MTDYAVQCYDVSTVVGFHKELAQESMLNNMDGYITAKLLLNMKTSKQVNIDRLKEYRNIFKNNTEKKLWLELGLC